MIVVVDDRKQLKIFVHARAKKVVEAFAEKFDMKEIGVASRLYNWFGTLPLPVQKWVIGLTDGDEGEGMKEFAKMLAASTRTAPFKSIPPDAPALDVLADKPAEQPERIGGSRGRGKSK